LQERSREKGAEAVGTCHLKWLQRRENPKTGTTPGTERVLRVRDGYCRSVLGRKVRRQWAHATCETPGVYLFRNDNPRIQPPNLKPQTPNPKPQTPNPKPQTPNTTPQTLHPTHQTPNTTPDTPNLQPGCFCGTPEQWLQRRQDPRIGRVLRAGTGTP